MTLDKRFALITNSDQILYPYEKDQRATGRYGFALTQAGNQDRRGGGDYTRDLTDVVRRVVLEGWGVRARTEDRSLDGSYMLGKRSITRYWVAPELRHVVSAAPIRPAADLPGRNGLSTTSVAVTTPEVVPLDQIEALSADDYGRALLTLDGLMTGSQRAMLIGHATAPERTLSMEEIAKLGGYPSHSVANLQYGKLGNLFADYFSVEGLENQTQAIAYASGSRDDRGHWQWTVRPALIEAMLRLGMIEVPPVPSAMSAAVQAEIDADPKSVGLSATDRVALVNARLGQGGYRKRMFRIWNGRCAVTGCTIDCALIASHAKAWADSDHVERLDSYNGLLLAASVDRLFDQGLIAFTDDGRLLAAANLDESALASVGLSPKSRISVIHERHRPYLRAHRIKHGFENDQSL